MSTITSLPLAKPAGRSTQLNPANKLLKFNYISTKDLAQEPILPMEERTITKTRYVEVKAESMINHVSSPDLPFNYSVNPYQGCEHGCIYCYARPTHNYWGYSSGKDFEEVMLVKTNAAEVLKREILAPNYKVQPIMLSGNTDCYQPAESKFQITRKILELMVKYKHPISIITKNAMILRDLDLLKELAKDNLVCVVISVTSLRDMTRRIMEPRASSVQSRLKAIQELRKAGIPVYGMLAPIIPGLNDQEIIPMVKKMAELGVHNVGYQLVRLTGDVEELFNAWLDEYFPDRKEKIIAYIKSCHGGKTSDSRFGVRMKGEGKIADIIYQQFQLAKHKYFGNTSGGQLELNTELFQLHKTGQMSLF